MNKTNNKIVINTVIGTLLICILIYLAIPKPNIPADLKASIDSLTTQNKKLIEHQKLMDSAISAYQSQINQIDNHISRIKSQTTIVNKYYNDLGKQIDQYQPTQIDSFFKSRYNY
jgi:peptidoglycan hydrolase CwlO-like protein